MKRKQDDFPEIGEEPGAAFNMAIQYLKRIDALLIECNMFSRMGKLVFWYNTLLALYRELSPVMNEEDHKKIKEVITGIVPKMEKINRGAEDQGTFNDLHHLETTLRMIMNEHDLLMPSKADPRFAVAGG